MPVESPWFCSSLGGKNRGFGSFSCWKETGGCHCRAPESLHACAVPPAGRALPDVPTCAHIQVLAHACARVHAPMSAWAHTCTLRGRVVAWTRSSAHACASLASCMHPHGHTHAHVCRYTSPWSRTHVPVPRRAPRFGVFLGLGRLGGNRGDWLMDLTLPSCSHGLWRGQPRQPRPAGPPLRPPGRDPPWCGAGDAARHLARGQGESPRLRGPITTSSLALAGQPCPHALPESWDHPTAWAPPVGTPR